MGSKGRIPPPYMRGPHPAIGMALAEPFGGPPIRPPPGSFPPFDMLPLPEILEQKLAAQHIEMERLATENQRFAATNGTLRQQLAAAQQDLNLLEAQAEAMKSEREQQIRGLANKISKLEAELREADHVKLELQQAHAEAQNLVAERQQLLSKVQQLTQDLQKVHADLQEVPALMAELDGLRQEYQHCRATFDYEKKLYNDHLETLQAMEKHYMAVAQEVEKLRAELNNTANVDRRPVYGAAVGYSDNDASRHSTLEKKPYEDSYNVPQGYVVQNANAVGGDKSNPTYVIPQHGQGSARTGYNVPPRGPAYNDIQRDVAFDAQGGPMYTPHRGLTYGVQRPPPTYDPQRAGGGGYNVAGAAIYDAQSRGSVPSSGGPGPSGSMPYGSATPAAAGNAYEATNRSANPVYR